MRNVLYVAISGIMMISFAGCAFFRSGGTLQDSLVGTLCQDTSVGNNTVPADMTNTLTAVGLDWTLTVQWSTDNLLRRVTWQKEGLGFAFTLPLRKRSRPFTYSYAGVTETMFGPYQPAFNYEADGRTWHVTMSHEQVDFPTEKDLSAMLGGDWYSDPTRVAVSREGLFVCLHVDNHPQQPSLGIYVWRLTVKGRQPSASTLEPFVKGRITMEPHSLIQATPESVPAK